MLNSRDIFRQEGMDTLGRIDLILHLSWSDIKARYARSMLGPLWLVLTTAISVVGLGYVWSTLFHVEKSIFIPFLSVGLVIWQFLSASTIEATGIYAASSAVMRNTRNPLLVFPFSMLCKNLIILAHNALIVIVVLAIYPPQVTPYTLLIIPGLFLVIANMAWMSALLAMIGARYRDIGPAVASFMTILFFLSPVIYKPEQLGAKAKLLWFNPFSHMIAVIRDPLAGSASRPFVYITLCVSLVFGWALMVLLMQKFRHRLIYWI